MPPFRGRAAVVSCSHLDDGDVDVAGRGSPPSEPMSLADGDHAWPGASIHSRIRRLSGIVRFTNPEEIDARQWWHDRRGRSDNFPCTARVCLPLRKSSPARGACDRWKNLMLGHVDVETLLEQLG
jgi:hypothetical protein